MRRLVKAGVIRQAHARTFSLASAWAELVGYAGSIWLNALRIAAALDRERALTQELTRRKKARGPGSACNQKPVQCFRVWLGFTPAASG